MTKKTAADGKSLSTFGKNNDMLLTHTEHVELEKYILYYWKLDPKTGVPYNQKKQPDQADVRLSVLEAKKNPILKTGLSEHCGVQHKGEQQGPSLFEIQHDKVTLTPSF